MLVASAYLSKKLINNIKRKFVLLKTTSVENSFQKFEVKKQNIWVENFFSYNLSNYKSFNTFEKSFDNIRIDFKKNRSSW